MIPNHWTDKRPEAGAWCWITGHKKVLDDPTIARWDGTHWEVRDRLDGEYGYTEGEDPIEDDPAILCYVLTPPTIPGKTMKFSRT